MARSLSRRAPNGLVYLFATTTSMATKSNPFPLDETLRDLALIRACDIDLSSLLSKDAETESGHSQSAPSDVDQSVERSYAFASLARAALKILHRGDVEKQGNRIEDIRGTLEDVMNGLKSTR